MGQFKPAKQKPNKETPWNEGTFKLLGIIAFWFVIGGVAAYLKSRTGAFISGVFCGPFVAILFLRFSYYRRINQSEL